VAPTSSGSNHVPGLVPASRWTSNQKGLRHACEKKTATNIGVGLAACGESHPACGRPCSRQTGRPRLVGSLRIQRRRGQPTWRQHRSASATEHFRHRLLGILLNIGGQILAYQGGNMVTLGWIAVVIGTAVFIWGCWNHAQGKGYPGALGLLGLLGCLGLLILVILPDKNK